MYLRHFALTRLPFETPAHTDELFASNARTSSTTTTTTSSSESSAPVVSQIVS